MKKSVLPATAGLPNLGLLTNLEAQIASRGETVLEIPIEQIKVTDNVRRKVGDVAELAASIKAQGLLQPVLVSPGECGDYALIFGQRRLEAHKQLKDREPGAWGKIRAIVVAAETLNADEVTEAQIVENIQRDALSAADLRQALTFLRSRGFSNKEIAARLGKQEGYVRQLTSAIHTLEANPELEALVAKSDVDITLTDIHEVKTLPAKSQVDLLAQRAQGNIKSVKDLRQKVKETKESTSPDGRQSQGSKPKGNDLPLWSETAGKIHLRALTLDTSRLDVDRHAALIAQLETLLVRVRSIPPTTAASGDIETKNPVNDEFFSPEVRP